MWEFPGGSAVTGDDSLTAAIREAEEEAGLVLLSQNGRLAYTTMRRDAFFDVWLFRQDFRIEDIVLQPGETVDAQYATADEIRILVKEGKFAPSPFVEELLAFANQY